MVKSFLSSLLGKKGAPALPWWQDAVFSAIFLALFLALIASLSVLLGYVAMHLPVGLWEIDIGLYRFVAGDANEQVVGAFLSFFNDPGVDYAVIIALCLGYTWARQRSRMMAATATVGLTLFVCAWTIPYTEWFGIRPRPFFYSPDLPVSPEWQQVWSQYSSFPSGHARELTGLSVVLVHFWPGTRLIALLYISLVAFSRVYIGAHFPYDVLGGLIIGSLSGVFAVLAMESASRVISSIAEVGAIGRAYDNVFTEDSGGPSAPHPVAARILRSLLAIALLVLATLLLGVLVFAGRPAVLADYLFHTDSSLVYPLHLRFDPSLAPVLHAFFLNGYYTIPALGALLLAYSALHGRKGFVQAVILIALAIAVSLLLATLLSPYFAKPRPFVLIDIGMPEVWRAQWATLGSFPDPYLLIVSALSMLLAKWWTRLRVLFYVYPFLVATSLAYFGAAWPIASVGTVMAGYWVAVCSFYLYWQMSFPLSRRPSVLL